MTAAFYATSRSGWGGLDVGFQPVGDSVESVLPVFKHVSDKPVGFIGIAVDKVPVGPQEGISGKEGCTLVSVEEWMVCGEAF